VSVTACPRSQESCPPSSGTPVHVPSESAPVRAEGAIVYNKTHKTTQFCNGTQWVAMAGGGGGGGSIASVTEAQRTAMTPTEGTVIYNSDNNRMEWFDGSNWVYASATSIAFVGTQTFNYTGSAQTFTVPAGVTSLAVDMAGAAGGTDVNLAVPGFGARVQSTISVTPGATLNLYVGGKGSLSAGGWNGGGNPGGTSCGGSQYAATGGGGSSDIRVSGTALANRIVVAGGGGGSSHVSHAGGGHAGQTGANGAGWSTGYGGGGASQSSGGTATGYTVGTPGTLGNGGNGGPPSTYYCGGGGGAGYYGGGGGSGGDTTHGAGGGGGGSSYSNAIATFTSGYRSGDGYITLSW